MSVILEHLINDHKATLAQAKAALVGWDIRPVLNGEYQVGEVMLKENEIHVAIYPQYQLKLGRGKLLNETLDALLKEKGFLVTKLIKNDRYRKQIERMGFAFTHGDEKYDYFWMNERG